MKQRLFFGFILRDAQQLLMFKNIQFLRGLAAFLVALLHGAFLIQSLAPKSLFIGQILHFGFIGVDIFFVISGFVSAHTLLNISLTKKNLIIYLKKRFLRIYLGYWPFYFLSILVTFKLSPQIINNWNLVNSFFLWFIAGYSDGSSLVLFVAWSLTYELIFYVLIAFHAIIPSSKLRLLILLMLILFGAFLLPFSLRDPLSIALSFACEFIMGFLLRQFFLRFNKNISLPFIILISLVSFCFGVIFEAEIGMIRTFTFGVFSLGIVALLVYLESQKHFIANLFFVELGNSSYTLYLIHSIYFYLLVEINIILIISSFNGVLRVLCVFMMFIILVAASLFYFKKIELKIYTHAIKKI